MPAKSPNQIATPTHSAAGRYDLLRMRNVETSVIGFAAIFLAACGSIATGIEPPGNVGGPYSGTVTNGPSTCPVNWDKGKITSAEVIIVQTEASVTIEVDGATGVLLEETFGTHSFKGLVSGRHIGATTVGGAQVTRGGCVFTLNGELSADLAGNILTGVIIYTPQTNGHADCRSLQVAGCNLKQTFGFTRNPI
jgi:hypothetical protein